MLTNQDYDDLTRPILELYSKLEVDLIREIASRFTTYDSIGGTLEWQIKKLKELGGLNQETVKLISKLSGISESLLKEMLEQAGYASVPISSYQNIFEQGGITVDPSSIQLQNVIDNIYKEVNQTFRLIQTKAREAVRQSYIEIINKTVLEVSTGLYDYNTSIKRSCENMVKKGFDYVTYLGKDGNVRRTSIEAAVRRETLTAVNRMANESNHKFAEELEAEYVETSWHEGARNKGTGFENHELWQGCVFKIHGSENKYPNFEESTGYGDILGLGGVNCRHTHHAFFPGYSIPLKIPDDYDHDLYDQLQEQRKNERNIRYWKKRKAAAEALGDEEGVEFANKKLQEWTDRNQQLVDSNPKLRRDFARERVYMSGNKANSQVQNNIASIEINEFHDYGDYLYEKLGPAIINNKNEVDEIINDVISKGGKVFYNDNPNKMVTNVYYGKPAEIDIYRNASIGAFRHEYRHFLDDFYNGSPGLGYYLKDRDKFFEYEKNGYLEELEIAKNMGYNEIVKKIEEEIEERRKEIYGE